MKDSAPTNEEVGLGPNNSREYRFLRTSPHAGNNPFLLNVWPLIRGPIGSWHRRGSRRWPRREAEAVEDFIVLRRADGQRKPSQTFGEEGAFT